MLRAVMDAPAPTLPSRTTPPRRSLRALPGHARGARRVLLVPVLVALVASGCGGSSSSTSGSSSASSGAGASSSGGTKPAVCDKRDAVKASVDDLLTVNPITDGMPAVTAKLDAVEQSVNDLASTADSQYQPQVTALKASVSALSTQVKALGSAPSAAAAAAIPAAAQTVATDFKALTDAIGSACD
jgi:hypothetical protein